MTLLAPLWLLAGALGAVVLYLHATRRREMAVPSLQIWQLLAAGNVRRKVRHRPPLTAALLLQLLAVLLAALALAQPRIGGAGADHFIFVLDGSGSMRSADVEGSRFAAAQADLVAVIAAVAGDGDVRVSVVLAGASPELVVARQSRPAGMVPLVEALRAGDGANDWSATLAVVSPLLRDGEDARVTILTDDASGGADAAEIALPPGTVLQTVRYGRLETGDAGLSARLIPIDAAAGRWRVEGTLTLTNGAPVPAEIAVGYAPGTAGDLLDWPPIAVRPPRDIADVPDAPLTVPFGGELDLPGAGRLQLELPGDAGPHNDAAFFVVPGSEPLRVLIVGPPDDDLVRALAALGPVEILSSERLPADLGAVDLVVVTGVVDRRPESNVLWLGQGRVAGEAAPEYRASADPTAWDSIHPLSRNVGWASLEAPAAYDVPELVGADTILAAGDAPLVQARTTAAGREVRVALDLVGSAFVDGPAFPVFVGNLVAWLDRGDDRACIAGAPCPLAARDLAARIAAPDGTLAWAGTAAVGALPRGFDRAFVPSQAGFYTAVRPDGTVTTYAINAAPSERTIATGPDGGGLPTSPFRLAAWFAGAALAVLLAEAFIAGRGIERFLRRAALRFGVPGAGRRRLLLALRLATLAAIVAAVLAVPVPVRGPAEAVIAITASAAGASAPFATAAAGHAESGRATLLFAATGGTLPGQHIEDAIRLAAAMLPADRAGRIVVASDGNETAGAIGAAMPLLVERDIPLDAAPLRTMPPGEVLVGRVEAGSRVRAGDSFPLSALVWSEGGGEADIAILRDGDLAVSERTTLRAGWNRIETVMPATGTRMLVEVTVSASGDAYPENNRDGTMVDPDGVPRILVLSSEMEWGTFFATALRAQGLESEVMLSDRAPRSLAGWLAYDVVVLMNIPALSLTTAQQELLEDAVRVHGRGLVILGGERAFGPGGYYATAFERLSPLSSRVPQETPRAAIVFVLDRSGSMQAPVDDLTRLDIAKEATLGAVMLLNEHTEVGIVVFDSEAQVLLPMQRGRDEEAFAAALAPLVPGGGTALHPALTEALALFDGVTAETRHIVVITDGLVEPVDFSGLLDEIVAAGITVSTVAVGTSAITDKLASIAADGGGAYHATADFKALPGILAQEAMYLATSPVTVGTRPVTFVDRSAAFLANLPLALPPIENFVATTAKPDADLHLVTLDDAGETMPLLASWRYGLGRVLAFATHGAGPGTRQWLALPEYPLLWAQTVRAFVPGVAGPGLHLVLARDGDLVRIEAYLVDPAGAPIANADLAATIDGGLPLPLIGEGDGRYTASFLATPGNHEVAVAGEGVAADGAVHVGYPALLDFTRARSGDLVAAASVTGGAIVDAVAALETGNLWRLQSEWRPWLVLALALLLADLALRQSALPRRRGAGLLVTPARDPDAAIPALRRAPIQ